MPTLGHLAALAVVAPELVYAVARGPSTCVSPLIRSFTFDLELAHLGKTGGLGGPLGHGAGLVASLNCKAGLGGDGEEHIEPPLGDGFTLMLLAADFTASVRSAIGHLERQPSQDGWVVLRDRVVCVGKLPADAAPRCDRGTRAPPESRQVASPRESASRWRRASLRCEARPAAVQVAIEKSRNEVNSLAERVIDEWERDDVADGIIGDDKPRKMDRPTERLVREFQAAATANDVAGVPAEHGPGKTDPGAVRLRHVVDSKPKPKPRLSRDEALRDLAKSP